MRSAIAMCFGWCMMMIEREMDKWVIFFVWKKVHMMWWASEGYIEGHSVHSVVCCYVKIHFTLFFTWKAYIIPSSADHQRTNGRNPFLQNSITVCRDVVFRIWESEIKRKIGAKSKISWKNNLTHIIKETYAPYSCLS